MGVPISVGSWRVWCVIQACDKDWCRILSVMAHGDLMLAAISGRRGIAAGVKLPAAGVQPAQFWRRELVAEFGWG